MPRAPSKKTSDQTVQSMLEIVIDRVSGLRDQVAAIDKKMDLHVQQNQFEFEAIRHLDEQQNAILIEHHDRSNQLKKDNELREASLRMEIEKVQKRIDELEKPKQALSYLRKVIIWAGGLATAITGIWHLYSKLK